jgi:hypothetical protein
MLLPRRYALCMTVVLAACSGGSSDLTNPPSTVAASITISGTTAVQVGQATKLAAVVKDGAGNVLTSAPVAWSSTDATLIAVAADGTVTPTRIGGVNITATSGAATASVAFTSSLAPYTFVFASGTSAADQQLIRDGVQNAHAFQKATFNRNIQNATTVSGATSAQGCANGGAAAFTGPGAVTFCVANVGWMANGPILKQKIVQHELFHVWQFEYHWLGNPATAGATWIIEGSAELVGFRGIAAVNLLSNATALGCQVKQVADFAKQNPPGLPALSQVESQQSFQTTVGPLYAKSMIAMDQLVTTQGLVALKTYGDALAAGTAWPTAFQTAFGTSTTTFYAQFQAYNAGLAVPPNYLCGV